ncbi:MAG: hypothetical protein Sylvanvirus18_2 [Sylvanvirus sp.]|uniref:Uncharacterized protein n=1 Tax=Sylvanvirus sp. TaxID=2487774 RepID=A0A3G5ALW8_9VIRU|nr:MAG: hypothetical protein Sylvanvirus18_2 [Sylvanvirus sp.]
MAEFLDSDEPFDLYPGEEVHMFHTDTADDGEATQSKMTLWTVIWGALALIVIIFLALWAFSVYQRNRLMKFGQQVGQHIGQAVDQRMIQGSSAMTSPLMSSMPGPMSGPMSSTTFFPMGSSPSSSTMPAVSMDNPQHVLMVSSQPNTPMMTDLNSPVNNVSNSEFTNEVQHPRVHFYHHGYDNKDGEKLFNQYAKLQKRCQKEDFKSKFGHVRFNRLNVSKAPNMDLYKQIPVNGVQGAHKYPMVTFAKGGDYNENVLGMKGSKTKEMLQNLVNNMKLKAPQTPQ